VKQNTSNIKIALQTSPSDREGVLLAQQLGVEYLAMWSGATTYEEYKEVVDQAAAAQLKVATCSSISNDERIVLALEGRDEIIEQYQNSLRAMGRAGLTYRTVSFMATGVTSSAREPARGGASARAYRDGFRSEEESYSVKTFSFEREYSEEELWQNYEYFIRAVAPVAEESGVRIGIHPEDPPGITLGNVPRVVGSSFAGYKRALEIADSPNVGLCLCLGCVLEAGENWGKTPVETIQYFGERNKIFKVHFRNVNQPLPHFVEAFVDDGYCDMYPLMKALRQVNNDCVLILDHSPDMVGGSHTGAAFAIGYIRALLERANEEVGT
jgi:mannonate dehydratase